MNLQFKVEAEIKQLNDKLGLCNKVNETINTAGWKEVIEPMIDKMIMDIVGSKVNGKWYGGLLDRAKKEERREFYVGYKQALIDLHQRVYAYILAIEHAKQKVEHLIANKDVKYKVPLVDDTSYNLEK